MVSSRKSAIGATGNRAKATRSRTTQDVRRSLVTAMARDRCSGRRRHSCARNWWANQSRAELSPLRGERSYRAVAPHRSSPSSFVAPRVVLGRLVDLESTSLVVPPMAAHHTSSSAHTTHLRKCLNYPIDTLGGSVQRTHSEILAAQHLRHRIALPMKRSALNPECVAGGTHVDPTIDQDNGVFA